MNRLGTYLAFGAACAIVLVATLGFAKGETITSVTDGDTVRIGKERIRLRGIDTPELRGARCPAERRKAKAAKAALEEMLANADVQVDRLGTDRYGRTLAVLRIDGWDVGARLIERGLALPWHPGAREKFMRSVAWCAEDIR